MLRHASRTAVVLGSHPCVARAKAHVTLTNAIEAEG
jgi:hypothetical protein